MRRLLFIVIIFLLIIIIPGGIFVTKMNTDGISEIYYKEITLTEDIVLDDQQFIEFYGNPITLAAGMKGQIVDVVDCNGDTKGYEYINTRFNMSDGFIISVAISIDPEAETTVIKTFDSNVTDILVVFSINKVESYQNILSEYLQTRENYHKRVRNEWIKGTVITITVAAAAVAAACFVNKRIHKIRNSCQDE